MPDNGLSSATADPTSEDRSAIIQRQLRAAGNVHLRRIECEDRDGVVILRGRVPTYYAKQLAQALLLADPAIHTVENLIEVVISDRSCMRQPR